ncbi:MAG: hypothetical protein WD022_09060 [Balneolaceae bacterium]
MNFGIIISYIIAGFLMLTILMVNQNVGFSNQEVTTTLVKTTHAQAISDIITNDIPKIGYQKKTIIDKSDIFISATNYKISFRSDLDNDGDIEIITWDFDPDKTPEHAKNPHINTLTRTVEDEDTGTKDVTNILSGVTDFQISYYSTYGSTTPMSSPIDVNNVVQIEIALELQSDYELEHRNSTGDNYIKSKWKKRFSPVNLRPN